MKPPQADFILEHTWLKARFLRLIGSLALSLFFLHAAMACYPAIAQQLDTDFGHGFEGHKAGKSAVGAKKLPIGKAGMHPPSAAVAKKNAASTVDLIESVSLPSVATDTKPFSATVSKTLYLPPAMYGEWSVNGTLMETNAQEYFTPTVNDIWILDRSGDQVVVSNPATGASAAISVDSVEGDRATFHREGTVGRNRIFQEIPTITVMGDSLTGQSINKISFLKNGVPGREIYAIYRLQAQRIAGARTRFQPENEGSVPDIRIEDVRIAR